MTHGGTLDTSDHVVLTFTGTNNFISNSAGLHGGAIYARTNVSLTFTGTSDFSNNSAQFDNGGAIYAETNTSLTFIGTSHFSIKHSMEPAILLATQLIYFMAVVVQSTKKPTPHCVYWY